MAAGLILATGLKLMPALKKNVMGVVVRAALAVLTFIAIALMHIPQVWVLLALGGAGGVWSWHQLVRVHVAIAK